MPYGHEKVKGFAVNVWDVNAEGKSDEQIANEGLECMEKWMKEIGLVMSIKEWVIPKKLLTVMERGPFILKAGIRYLIKMKLLIF